jgi:D-glycero-D-manno-heptose 1,7-bisphosphate phosphatase
VVPELKGPCQCRKPSPYFLEAAVARHGLSREACWMVGDQDFDVECGRAAGVHTIMINVKESAHRRGKSRPDHTVSSLEQAAALILKDPA